MVVQVKTASNCYFQNSSEQFNALVKLVQENPKGFSILLEKNPKYKSLFNWINSSLPILADGVYQLRTKCYWIFNGLTNFPICPVCGQQTNYIGKNVKINVGYSTSCCRSCALQNVKRIEKIQQTNMIRYGGISSFCSKAVIEKAQNTMLERYGAKSPFCRESSLYAHLYDKLSEKTGKKITNPSQIKEIAEKAKQTKVERYGKAGFDIEKQKATCMERYGSEYYSSTDEFRKKYKNTCLKKYGVENSFQVEEYKEKSKQTCVARYGVEYYSQTENHTEQSRHTCLKKYGVEHYSKTDECKERIKQTCRKKYGTDYFTQTLEYIEKIKQTSRTNYGTDFYVQTEEYKEKSRQTCIEQYGVEYYVQTNEYKKHARQTCLEKYGVEYPIQNREIMLKCKQKYIYDGIYFDSSPELALYIYLKDTGANFQYQPNVFFWYEYKGKESRYFPDFKIDNRLIEIKGNQFLKEDGTWQCPYDNLLDDKYEAKRQYALANNVEIWYSVQYKKYIDYVKNKYGKDCLYLFRNQTQK